MTKYRDMDDGTLVNLTLLGEEDAFSELVERYEEKVNQKAEAIIGNPYSAEDVAQDTFLAAWTQLGKLRYRDKFGIWILRVAENRAKTLLKHYRLSLHELSSDLDTFPDQNTESILSLNAWHEAENREKLRDAVDALSNSVRETVRLHYLDGYPIRNIAILLSVPEGTVKWRLREGRKQLRRGFGVPEEGDGKLAARVKRQIEELKRWATKNDKSGFTETYGPVLSLAEQIEDSERKNEILADVLLHGMWWIPGQDNIKLREHIKATAIETHNEDVMKAVTDHEIFYLRGEEKIRFIREKEIPELEATGFKKPLGAQYYWLGNALAAEGWTEEALVAFGRVFDYLPPSHPYYACAKSSIRAEPKFAEAKDPARARIVCIGEVYAKENGKWIYISQPGYTRGIPERDMDALPLFWLSRCGGLIDDPGMKPGGTRVSEDGRVTLTLKRADGPVEVPAGVYENCLIYETKGEGNGHAEFDIETVVCPGVGIVRQTNRSRGVRFMLTAADVKGEGRIPFAVGNRWTYHAERGGSGILWRDEQITEIISVSDTWVTASVSAYAGAEYDTASWRGNMAAVRDLYGRRGELCDVEPYLRRAEELAVTSREKAHTAAAADCMRRIFRTDPKSNPECTELGVWNFFRILFPSRTKEGVALFAGEQNGAFEWKSFGKGLGFFTILYNSLYEIATAAWGMIWSDEWIPGFAQSKNHLFLGKAVKTELRVEEDETIRTPAGEFPNCRHIAAVTAGFRDYWSGRLEFWYAPGVGLVKFERTGTNDEEPEERKGPFVWELTEYHGTGDGYFPLVNKHVDDGLFRRYEPADQPLSDGYRGWVEYTFSTDETGTMIFKNACGVQERGKTAMWFLKNAQIEV